jgi:cytochrome c554/c'-like protein
MAHRLRASVKLGSTAGVVAALLLLPVPARPQYVTTGPSKCVACHDHDRQASKWQKEEPAALGIKAHFNTRKQLDGAKAGTYAKAIGLADPYDLKGSCVKCHATVFRGDANAGVSCESCHGAASGYLDLHQVKGSYAKAVAAGLRDLREKPAVIAKLCVDCHVTPDKRLAAAGHPSGSTFDAGANLQKIVHWTASYNYAQVSAAGKAAMGSRVVAGGGVPPPSPVSGGKAPPATPAVPASVVPAAPSRAAAATPAPAAQAPAPPPAPWDFDQPIRPLPKEYVPEPAPEPAAEPAPAAAARDGAARPAARPRPRPQPVPPSIAEDVPLPRSIPGLGEANAVTPAVQAAVTAESGVRSPAARVAELRGRGVVLLERLLRARARAPALPPPARPSEFRGPDSELLRLQDEVTVLAIEALRRPR